MILLLIFSLALNLLLAAWLIVWKDQINEQSIFIEGFKHRERLWDNWRISDLKVYTRHVAQLENEITQLKRSKEYLLKRVQAKSNEHQPNPIPR